VLGVCYSGGVVLAADIGGYYGSMARFKSLHRLIKVNNTTVLGSGGDFADFQYLSDIVKQKV
jgi:20S proteasome subunit beta 7